MSSRHTTIYVPLLEEGINVWRPVEAHKVAPNAFLIVQQDYDPEVETWQFEPGTVVRCRRERRNGRQILVAIERLAHTAIGYQVPSSPTEEALAWRGKLKLSLVTCPVCLYSAIKDTQERRRNIDGNLSIEMFVDRNGIDLVLFDDLYYLAPDGRVAEETYAVIYESMRRKNVAAVCMLEIDGETRQVALLPGERIFRLYLLRRLDEIVQEQVYFDRMNHVELDSEMISLAETLVDQKRREFEPAILMIGETQATNADLEAAVSEGIRTGKVISLKHALERSVDLRGKSRTEGSG